MSAPPAPATEQEFVVRVPSLENANKKHHVMKFNASQNMDFSKWSQVRMVRENNMKTFSQHNMEDMPKHGAGSEFGREEKEEARKKKFGYVSRKYKPEDQPWLMRIGGKNGRKYKGVREGGVSANTTYYVFTHAQDGSFEAYPVHEWYNFTPIMRYKTLDADEAEEKFAQRGKILNKWAMMVNKKLKPDQEDDEDLDGDGEGKKKGKKTAAEKKELKISELDDWEGSDDGLDTDDDEKEEKDDDSDDGKKKKGKGKDSKAKKKKGKKNQDISEAFEDDGDGSDEDREVDYMSDESSASEEEIEKERELKGVDQDQGLSKMLDSDDSESDDEKKKKEGEKSDEEKDGEGKKKKGNSEKGNSSDEEGGKGKKKKGSANSSRSTTPTKDVEKHDKAEKRKAMVANLLDPNASNEPSSKKSRLDQFGSSSGAPISSAANEAISEEAVRKYLTRRPMTTTDLLKKFRSKKTGIQNAQLVQLLAQILKKINPHKQKIKGTTYLSLKEGK